MRYDIRHCRMIYLLRKHGIISVPSYAEGIYHPPKVGIISKIYHPFREERISLKTPSLYHNEGVFMVEPRRIELLSESKSANLSTRLVYLLKFPHSTPTNRIADTVALWCVNSYKALAENVGCWSTPWLRSQQFSGGRQCA